MQDTIDPLKKCFKTYSIEPIKNVFQSVSSIQQGGIAHSVFSSMSHASSHGGVETPSDLKHAF